jgi:hypothetical protein
MSTGVAAQSCPALQQAAAGTTSTPGINGTISQTLPALAQAATGTAPTTPGTAAQTLPTMQQAATGVVTAPTFTGAAAQTLPSLGQSLAGSAAVLPVNATLRLTIPSLQQLANGVTSNTGGIIRIGIPALVTSAFGVRTGVAPPVPTGRRTAIGTPRRVSAIPAVSVRVTVVPPEA